MRQLIIVVFLVVGFNGAFAGSLADSVNIDHKKMKKIVKSLRKGLEKIHYYMSYQKDFYNKDISFSYPEKIGNESAFDLQIIWKERVILVYGIDPSTYKLVPGVLDLR